MVRDSRKRSIVKSICYRTIVSIIAFMIAYWATDSIIKSIHVIVFYLAGSMIIYYIHERIWVNFIKFGLVEDDEDNVCKK